MTIARDDLKGCHMRDAMHFTGQGFFGYVFRCVEHPRLSRKDVYKKKDRSVTSTFMVDGDEVENIEAAVAKLNEPVVLTEPQAALLARVPEVFTDLRRDPEFPFDVMHELQNKGVIEFESGKCRRRA